MAATSGGINTVMSTSQLPLRIRKVRIEGNKRTRPHVVEDELQEAYAADTVKGVCDGLFHGAHQLEKLGLFDSVNVAMDKVDGSLEETDVTITLKEKNWYTVSIGTTSGDGRDQSMSLAIAGGLRNVSGHGEVFDVAYNRQTGSASFNARLAVPRILGADASFTLEGLANNLNLIQHCSLTEIRRGVVAAASTLDRAHTIMAELGVRDLMPHRHPTTPFASSASLTILGEAMPSTKGSLKYTYTDDRRDDPILPTAGALFQASAEGAGLVGDTTFAKGGFLFQQHIPLALVSLGGFNSPISLSLCASGGAVRPLGSCWRTSFSDRYDLGGGLMLRGFGYMGAGPRAPKEEGGCKQGDALRGDIRYTASASLSFPLPVTTLGALGWRGQLFANMGNLTTWETPLSQYAQDTRVSVGLGMAINLLGAGRLELNYGHALRKAPQDITSGFQYGFGLTFY